MKHNVKQNQNKQENTLKNYFQMRRCSPTQNENTLKAIFVKHEWRREST